MQYKHITFLEDDFNKVMLHDPSEEVMRVYKNIPELTEIDNRGAELRRPLFSHSSLATNMKAKRIHIKDFKFNTNYAYSVLVHHNSELWSKHLEVIPDYVLNDVRQGKCKLIFDDSLEGTQIEFFVKNLYESADKLNLPVNQLYYIGNNLYTERDHSRFVDRNNIKKRINFFSFMYNVYDIKRLIQDEKALPETVNIKEEIQYKKDNFNILRPFLKVNRTNRLERNAAMLMINLHDYYDKFYISFPEYDLRARTHPDILKPYFRPHNVESLKAKCPFDIDKTDQTNHGPAGIGAGKFNADLPFQPIHYRNTLFSLVMCAFPFDRNSIHLHSSTYNPLYCGHPIIQFGPQGALQELRMRGIHTFSDFWPEKYDDIADNWQRFMAVMNLA